MSVKLSERIQSAIDGGYHIPNDWAAAARELESRAEDALETLATVTAIADRSGEPPFTEPKLSLEQIHDIGRSYLVRAGREPA